MLAGMAAGGALLVGPAILRLRLGVDEVVTTLLLNFVAILFVGMMIEGPLRDPLAFGWPQSVPVAADLRLPPLAPLPERIQAQHLRQWADLTRVRHQAGA